MKIKDEKFAVEVNKQMSPNETTIGEMQVYSDIVCASLCADNPTCCTASYSKASKQCKLYSCCEPKTVPSSSGIFLRKLPDLYDILDCSDIPNGSPSGVYTIYHKDGPFDVYCDVNTDGIWTVIQRRLDGVIDFYRNWQDYKHGFGNVNSEYWLGNDHLHHILSARDYRIRIDLQDWNGGTRYVEYDIFFVGNEAINYVLTIGNYSGNVEDSIVYSGLENCKMNGMAFSTWDADNDNSSNNCAANSEHAGWWYNSCTRANLNGIYYNGGVIKHDGMYWENWYNSDYSLKKIAIMKIKPKYLRCSESNG
ncbi:Fibrinogen-like protein A,Angiopoietin-related protein 7,Techylectin-5A,Ficolin-2,Ryncolin-1,Tenascin-R,Fibrinogen-like protein 1,Angiopoietin-1,Fibrinogen C domain-containing protein 1-A,Tenascin-N,Ryncolin-3,Tenascin,Fibroleukin,Fibrinogen C domain-containing protein 1,Fibrinogen gamma chain,Ryncolin-2,Techylectin-5B,Fibrinogen alpha chain,Fibrinogen gamma-B chain,Ficolin-1,Fibrinogen C domain-containing protein 1-B,Angiopoietin-4 [Mytilus coruscus]|uniref:Fibrinogen C-terminal domain-containing protein n=1 Tax=Mytilus coruscus TaxID=42192 RepID=A0A6J8CL92_MYTCO|nr:Fibrinogen-like protein A,Angiopoietin-related protein 7,Techylectin-5A,Ficolin-2,Ryncolin-1,Tenascin-R,Fibrinogen-like protein 1,Angiopoietin-1,Fibrinogen C domain-containing protein 1-A,Tenascin-N,Ryncolin-3,Tenascin,Fibroleukin,Fibrinogen C domain-containing protein 1,Fibrinogen gamma chain,Ryncolin-2,Techylectin-5B,Fibrinogen alpha chain,Fibrinogen gamma-B chain,Ficolin-1,Fibrinogen C domain-containing protein 1-B,Angiopoietin-4 [Mytilus coruscus]